MSRLASFQPHTILVRTPNWIGDQVMSYPFFHYLRRLYPKAKITAACMSWVESVQFRNLVNDVYVLPRPVGNGFRSKLKAVELAARELREKGAWDLGIALPNSVSSAWLLLRAGARVRRGYRADGRGLFLNQGLKWSNDPSIHRAETYTRLLPGDPPAASVKMFWGIPPEDETDLGVPGVLSRFDAEKAWSGAEVLDPPAEPYWVLAPGSVAESRRWPVEKFAELARIIVKEKHWPGIIVGGAAEAPLAAELLEERGVKLRDWTARGKVSSYWKIFRNAKFTVSNDSGLAHLAAICGSPVALVWGAGDPKRTAPLGPGKVKITLNPVDCWPCERNTCSRVDAGKLACLRGIQPEEVWEDIKNGFKP